MPTNPTTRSQVQAYRFVLRRMESALVRKDAVMLHEPMRNHMRASVVGLILGVLGLAAFFVLGLFKSAGKIEVNDIVNVAGTTKVYVAVATEDKPLALVPVFNVTSARLLVIAHNSEPGKTKTVEQSAVNDIPHLPQVGRPDWPQDLPDPEKLVDGAWSVCDTTTIRNDLPSADQQLSTTVIAGGRQGRPLGMDQEALLLEDSNGAHYLVWNGRRLPVDLAEGRAAGLAYELDDEAPRKISDGLLNAIPQGLPLAPPDVAGDGDRASFPQLPSDIEIGDVVQVDLVEDEYFLILKQGKQKVEPAVARLIRSADSTSIRFKEATPEAMDRVPLVPESDRLDFADFPPVVPRVLGVTDAPVACLVWPGADQEPVIMVSSDEQLLRGKGVPVTGAGSDQAGRVILEGGGGALVYGVVPGQRAGTGQIWLVTSQEGQIYGVPSVDVAHALSLGDKVTPAPQSILDLLKEGPELNPHEALRLYSAHEETDRPAGR